MLAKVLLPLPEHIDAILLKIAIYCGVIVLAHLSLMLISLILAKPIK